MWRHLRAARQIAMVAGASSVNGKFKQRVIDAVLAYNRCPMPGGRAVARSAIKLKSYRISNGGLGQLAEMTTQSTVHLVRFAFEFT